MSYTGFIERGRKVFLCWNCGRIHLKEIAAKKCSNISNNFQYRFLRLPIEEKNPQGAKK